MVGSESIGRRRRCAPYRGDKIFRPDGARDSLRVWTTALGAATGRRPAGPEVAWSVLDQPRDRARTGGRAGGSSRRSGLIRRNALVMATHDGNSYVVALAGESEWVRNVRAADGQVVIGRRQRRTARLVKIPPEEWPRSSGHTYCAGAASRTPLPCSAKLGCSSGQQRPVCRGAISHRRVPPGVSDHHGLCARILIKMQAGRQHGTGTFGPCRPVASSQ
jgi:F420H(2)-dependent quinone reductase